MLIGRKSPSHYYTSFNVFKDTTNLLQSKAYIDDNKFTFQKTVDARLPSHNSRPGSLSTRQIMKCAALEEMAGPSPIEQTPFASRLGTPVLNRSMLAAWRDVHRMSRRVASTLCAVSSDLVRSARCVREKD